MDMGLTMRSAVVMGCLLLAGCGGGGGGGAAGTTAVGPPLATPPAPTLVAAETRYAPSGRLHEQGSNVHHPPAADLRTGTWSEWSDATPAVLISQKTYVDGVWDQALPWFTWRADTGAPIDDWTNAHLTATYAAFDSFSGGNQGIIVGGSVDTARYQAMAADMSLVGVNQRLGPDFAYFHGAANPTRPTVYQPHGDGIYEYLGHQPSIYFGGTAGDILYVPTDPTNYGADCARFSWFFEGGIGGAQYYHWMQLAPLIDLARLDGNAWFTNRPNASLKPDRDGPGLNSWATASGGLTNLRHPLATARAKGQWSNCGIMIFPNGLIGATGYLNHDEHWPFAKLPANKIPTAVAMTPNNEFALITIWDTSLIKGQVAVVAMEARAPGMAYHEWWYAGMPSAGTYTRLKILGYVDLPFKAPSAIAASGDITRWLGVGDIHDERLTTQAIRDLWNTSSIANGKDHRACSAGFAVVASRAENQVAFLDLEPLYQYYRSMYFTTQANFDLTTNEGQADNQWPYAFAYAPQQTPTVATTITVPQPTLVATGLALPYTDPWVNHAFIGTMDGRLLIYDAGYLAVTGSSGVGVHATGGVNVGFNPIGIAYGNNQHPSHYRNMYVVSRGDRKVTIIAPRGDTGVVLKTLQDSRLPDPVSVDLTYQAGADVMTVADFSSSTILNYLTAPIEPENAPVFGGLGADGTALFELTGSMTMPGHPFEVSITNIN
jgi:hypothetical protein